MPRTAAEVQWLYERGIRQLLSFERIPRWLEAWQAMEDLGLSVTEILVPDCEAPTDGQAEEILEAMREALASRAPLLFHCLAGVGRCGVAHGLYLIEMEGLAPEEAERIAGTENRSQAGFLLEWAARRREGDGE